MLGEILRLCEEQGLQKPSCYQGEYNVVTRGMETKLLPLLRTHGMTFNAFRYVLLGSLYSIIAYLAAYKFDVNSGSPDLSLQDF